MKKELLSWREEEGLEQQDQTNTTVQEFLQQVLVVLRANSMLDFDFFVRLLDEGEWSGDTAIPYHTMPCHAHNARRLLRVPSTSAACARER